MAKWSDFFADVLESASSVYKSTFPKEKSSEQPFLFISRICLYSEMGEFNLKKKKNPDFQQTSSSFTDRFFRHCYIVC